MAVKKDNGLYHQSTRPPRLAFRFLAKFCPDHLYEEIEGDLIQNFNRDVKTLGEKRARRRLMWTVIRFCRPGIILRNTFSTSLNQVPMFQNYFKTTYRHLLKNKVNFSFKLGGLTLALFSFLVITIYVSFQLSFDRYHDDYKNIYRVNSQWMENGNLSSFAVVPKGVGPALKAELPEIKSFARVGHPSKYLIKYKDNALRLTGFTIADSSIFDVLTFKFIRGDRYALNHPGSIILTRSMAKQIFGDEDPMNKPISFTDRSNTVFEVTALIEDLPANSHLDIKALLPHNGLSDPWELDINPWEISIDGSTYLYVRFNEIADVESFNSKVAPIIRKNIQSTDGELAKDYHIFLQPIQGIYLADRIQVEFCKKGNATYVYVFSLLGVFLLAIASINYVNLSIADFHKRNKEIGVRKVLGARKKQIAFQVSLEAIIFCLLASTISVGILYFVFPQVLQLLDPELNFNMLIKPEVIATLGITIIVLVILSTAYPAYQLSRKKTAIDLKFNTGLGRNSRVGQSLLLIQFVISVICISATIVVRQQIGFIRSKDPGYDRHNVVVLFMPDRYPDEKIPVIKSELQRLPGVEAVSYSTFLIAGGGYYKDWYRVEVNGVMKSVQLNEVFFDHDFFDVMGVPLIAGRTFDINNPADAHGAFIINETAAKEFGWDDPIGKRMAYGQKEAEGEKWEGTVVGVMKDYNVYSMRRKIEPLVMRLPWSNWPGNCLYIKVKGPVEETITSIKNRYEQVLPDFVAEYHLIESLYDKQYDNEAKAFTVLQFTTWIIVLISSLGIFSLSAYLSVRRMKEFGIRKVFGATVQQIASLHIGYFVKIVLIANIIALPIAYWLMKEWLDGFAYRTEPSGLVFLAVMCISFLLVIISGGYSAWKAGRMNPVDVIKIQ